MTTPRPSRAARASSNSAWHSGDARRAGGRTRRARAVSDATWSVGAAAAAAVAGAPVRSAIGTDSPVAHGPRGRPVADGDRPDAGHGGGAGVEVEDEGGVLVDAEDEDVVGQVVLQDRQPALAHVAVPGVVVAALGVVVVGHDRRPQAGLGQQVEALQPVGLLADLVHLVHRQGEGPEGDGGGAGEGDAPAGAELLGQHRRHLAALPLGQGVGRAARARRTRTGRPAGGPASARRRPRRRPPRPTGTTPPPISRCTLSRK